MRFFGRKANSDSTKPAVPPELQPYYTRPTFGTHARRVGLFVLPVLATAALVVALIVGGVQLKNRIATSKSPAAVSGQTSGGASSGDTQSNNQQSQQPGSSSTAPATSQTSGTQPAAPADIPDTGPENLLVLPFVAASIAIALNYARQLRHIRSEE